MIKRLLIALVIALVFYAVLWNSFEYLRTRKGPWAITFIANTNEPPAIVINQKSLGISNLKLVFEGAQTPPLPEPKTVYFDHPQMNGPFGKWIFDDLMFQPGTVTLEMFGHEVEFLPRVLYIDRKEIPWRSDDVIIVKPKEEEQGPGASSNLKSMAMSFNSIRAF